MSRRPCSVPEAAVSLGVSPQRVRALIAAGTLPARRIGGRWLVDDEAVERRRQGARLPNRPLSPRNAWALLWIAAGERPAWVGPAAASRLRGRLASRGLAAEAPLLARRARLVALRVHPGERARLLDDPAFVRSGVAATADHGLALVAPDAAEGYVNASQFEQLVARHSLRTSDDPNVRLHVVADLWPFRLGVNVAPLPVVIVDLLENDEPRARSAALAVLT